MPIMILNCPVSMWNEEQDLFAFLDRIFQNRNQFPQGYQYAFFHPASSPYLLQFLNNPQLHNSAKK